MLTLKSKVIELKNRASSRSVLDELIQEGARQMLQSAVEAEVAAYIEAHQGLRDESGHRLVVRNGYQHERIIQTGAGQEAARERPARGRALYQQFAAALPAPIAYDRCANPGAVSEGRIDR